MNDEYKGPEEVQEQEGNKGRWSDKLLRPVPIAATAVALCLLVTLFVFISLRSAPDAALPPSGVEVATDNATASENMNAGRAYEEPQGPGIAEQVRLVDFSLLEALKVHETDFSELHLDDVEVRSHEGEDYHFQKMTLPEPEDISDFLADLHTALERRLSRAQVEKRGSDLVSISVDGVQTHTITFSHKPKAPLLGDGAPQGPIMAVVIDDVGENLYLLRRMLKLDIPLAYAVWPHSTHTFESARLIRESGNPLLIHFPMQPQGWPETNPGKGAVFTDMTADQIKRIVRENLELVPGAQGVNNHMGSAFTEFYTGMKVVLNELDQQGLFFLDSRTTSRSAGRKAARKVGIPFYRRDVFIDNTRDVQAIILQLKKAERIARKHGMAIAIGHPHKETVAALEKWQASLDGKVSIVPITQISPEFKEQAPIVSLGTTPTETP
ncbi:divergent polysaccharide deacetylase family protein [Desulfovibrio oxyclinae]|uniref:divergent polysaccharide deacetylase family protein n=1 Tax=Desulfovibrio oxyclinae TaxID=63560 RepID=UPI000365D39A|nr:divergent polysaccharide deacetylase family protein [Desulfovibrio oxyclinae]